MDNIPPLSATPAPPNITPTQPSGSTALAKQPGFKNVKYTGIFGICLALLQIIILLLFKFVFADIVELDTLFVGVQTVLSLGLLFISFKILRSVKPGEVRSLLNAVLAYALISLLLSLFLVNNASGLWIFAILVLFAVQAKKELKKAGF